MNTTRAVKRKLRTQGKKHLSKSSNLKSTTDSKGIKTKKPLKKDSVAIVKIQPAPEALHKKMLNAGIKLQQTVVANVIGIFISGKKQTICYKNVEELTITQKTKYLGIEGSLPKEVVLQENLPVPKIPGKYNLLGVRLSSNEKIQIIPTPQTQWVRCAV